MQKPLISPSILNVDANNLLSECVLLENCGADWIHCDVMDGIFVPNVSLQPSVVAAIKNSVKIPLDVHLMVENPRLAAEEYIRAGADIITFHLEATDNPLETMNFVKNCGVKVGIAIKPSTPVDAVLPYAKLLDMILVMTVEPGFGGQKFIAASVEKIMRAKQLFPNKLIQVDGGINGETAQLSIHAGANVLVAGSYIVNSSDKKECIANLKNL